MPDRIVSNGKKKENVRHKLEMFIEPLNSDNHSEGIVKWGLEELRLMLSMSLILWVRKRNMYRCLYEAV